MPKPMKY